MLWDLYQQAQIQNLQRRNAMADTVEAYRHAAHKVKTEALEERLDHLTVVCEALWTLLHETLGLSDEQLVAAVTALLEEHEAERSEPVEPARCPGCRAALNRDLDHCQFCGYGIERQQRSPFDKP